MIQITAQEAAANFASLSALLIQSAPTQKAVDFANKVIAQIEARGSEWVAKNAAELQLLSDHKNDFCPVADNRVFFMTKFQTALMAA